MGEPNLKFENGYVIAEVRGFKLRVSLNIKEPEATFKKLIKMLEEGGLKLSNDERKELLEQYFSEVEGFIAKRSEKVEVGEKEPIFSFQEGNARVNILESDGVRLYVPSIAYAGEHEAVVGELSYAYATVQKENEKGELEAFETVEPVIAVAKYRDGALVERSVNSPRFLKTVEVEGRKALLVMETRLSSAMETLPDILTFKSFEKGGEAETFPELFREGKGNLKRFLNFNFEPAYYDVATCWDIGTYFSDFFRTYPFGYFYGATAFGKTRGCTTLTLMARHGFMVTDPTDPAFYRMAEAFKPTLGIDEAIVGVHMWKLVRTAFKKGIRVPRMKKTVKGEFVLDLFETYTPAVFAATELPTELGGGEADVSRAIFFYMKQMPDPSGRDPTPSDFKEWREKMYLARLTRVAEVLRAFKEMDVYEVEAEKMKVSLTGHLRECWRPILAIASLCGKEVFDSVKAFIVKNYAKQEEALYEKEKKILGGVWDLFSKEKKLEAIFQVKQLQQNIMSYEEIVEEDEIKSFKRENSLEKIGRLLHRMGVRHVLVQGKTNYIISLKEAINFSHIYRFFNNKQESCNMFGRLLKLRDDDKEKEKHEDFYRALEEFKAAAEKGEEQQASEKEKAASQQEETKPSIEPSDVKGKDNASVEYNSVKKPHQATPPNTSGGVGGVGGVNLDKTGLEKNGDKPQGKNLEPVYSNFAPPTPPTPPETVGWSKFSGGVNTPPNSQYKCGSCLSWSKNRCELHPEWAIVTPDHPACEKYQPRESGG